MPVDVYLQKSPARSFRCVAFSAKSHAGSSYALVNAGITPPLRYQLFAGASAVHGRFLESYNSTQVFYLAKCRYEHPYQTCGRQFITNCRPLFTMWFDLKRNFLNHLNIVIADFVLSSMAFLYVIGDPRRFLREDSGAGRSLALAQPGNVPVSASPPESGEPCCRRQAQPNKRPVSARQVHRDIFVSRGMQRLPETIQPAGPGKLLKKMQERSSAAPVSFTNRGQAGILHP